MTRNTIPPVSFGTPERGLVEVNDLYARLRAASMPRALRTSQRATLRTALRDSLDRAKIALFAGDLAGAEREAGSVSAALAQMNAEV